MHHIFRDQYSAEILHGLLSKALGIPLNSKKRLKAIVESNYVLTLDYTLKMLNINERRMCGVPVIIEGETGVGKTALIEMLSKLWNSAIVLVFDKAKEDVIHYLERVFGELTVSDDYEVRISSEMYEHLIMFANHIPCNLLRTLHYNLSYSDNRHDKAVCYTCFNLYNIED